MDIVDCWTEVNGNPPVSTYIHDGVSQQSNTEMRKIIKGVVHSLPCLCRGTKHDTYARLGL